MIIFNIPRGLIINLDNNKSILDDGSAVMKTYDLYGQTNPVNEGLLL